MVFSVISVTQQKDDRGDRRETVGHFGHPPVTSILKPGEKLGLGVIQCVFMSLL
jgi:hypothetical protein